MRHNKADQHPLDVDQRGLMYKYPQIKSFVSTSCDTGQGISELKKQITEQLRQLKHIHDILPTSWRNIKDLLEQEKRDFISQEYFQDMCIREKVDEDQVQKELLTLLHDLGTILSYHDDPRLAETNVLNLEWVTNGVYTILNHEPLLQKKSGIVTLYEIIKILEVYKNRYPPNKCYFISDMMEKFELCFRIERGQWLVPDLLPKEEPTTGLWENCLHFIYRYPVLPNSIIGRFIVRSQYSIDDNLLWRNGVVLKSGDNRALIKADPDSAQIDIRIIGDTTNRRRFLSAIRYTFEQIHNTLSGLRDEIQELVPLPNYPNQFVEYAELLGWETEGQKSYFNGKLRKSFPLKKLLNGYETHTERQARQINSEDYNSADIEHRYYWKCDILVYYVFIVW